MVLNIVSCDFQYNNFFQSKKTFSSVPTSLHCIITVLCYFNIAHFKTYRFVCVLCMQGHKIKGTEAGASVPLTLLSYAAESEYLSYRSQIQKPCHTFFFTKKKINIKKFDTGPEKFFWSQLTKNLSFFKPKVSQISQVQMLGLHWKGQMTKGTST
jgi:hypothetical protein